MPLVGGAWVADPGGTWRLALTNQAVDCAFDTWVDRMTSAWTRVICPAEGGRMWINHADEEGWNESEAYNFASCNLTWEVAGGRVAGQAEFTDEDDGTDRGSVRFDVPDCG